MWIVKDHNTTKADELAVHYRQRHHCRYRQVARVRATRYHGLRSEVVHQTVSTSCIRQEEWIDLIKYTYNSKLG